MALIKICPSCDFHNPISQMMCQECMAFIGDVTPVEETPAENVESATPQGSPVPDSGATIRVASGVVFCDESGAPVFTASDGEIVGRQRVGAEYLANMLTVSRSHCRVSLTSGGWMIEDVGSSNGTWINGARVVGPAPLRDGDRVGLSQSCVLRVKL